MCRQVTVTTYCKTCDILLGVVENYEYCDKIELYAGLGTCGSIVRSAETKKDVNCWNCNEDIRRAREALEAKRALDAARYPTPSSMR